MPDNRWTQPTFEKRYGRSHDLEPHDTAYYAVEKPFTLWTYTGRTRESNHWYGSSNLASCELRAVLCQPGDEIHALYGALWIVRAGEPEACQACLEEPVKLRASVFPIMREERSQVKYRRA